MMVSGVTMRGYLGDPPRGPGEEWATGDLGEIDADGYVYVRGRLRNMYITSYGRNVAPEWVEREIALEPAIRHVMVHGEARPCAVAIVSAARDDVDAATIDRAIRAANARLPDLRAGAPLGARDRAVFARERAADLERPAAPARDRRAPRGADRVPVPRRNCFLNEVTDDIARATGSRDRC